MASGRKSTEQKQLFVASLLASKACFGLICDPRVRGIVLPGRSRTSARVILNYNGEELASAGDAVIDDKGFGATLVVEGQGPQWTFVPWAAVYGFVGAWPLDFPPDLPPAEPLH